MMMQYWLIEQFLEMKEVKSLWKRKDSHDEV